MRFTEYLINNRQFTHFYPFAEEFNLQKGKNYLFELSYLSSLKVLGEQAAKFLQGQLSCDIKQVTSSAMRQGALCNLKGRILALLDVIDWQGFQLVLPRDLIADTQNSLSKTAMLSRVSLEPSTSYQFYGFYLNNLDDLLLGNLPLPNEHLLLTQTNTACCYSLGHSFYLIVVENKQSSGLVEPFITQDQFRGSLAWHQLQLRQKQVLIYPETRGQFLPHRLDLHLSGHLSFDKGCYKGQEIIARTHYRATLKHSLQVLTLETQEPLLAGKKLFDATGKKEVGELVDFSPLNTNSYLIAASVLHEFPQSILIEGQQNPVSLSPFTKEA